MASVSQTSMHSDVFTVAMASLAPFWVELAFLACFVLGFLFLRVEGWRRAGKESTKKGKSIKASKLDDEPTFDVSAQKNIDVEAAAGNWSAVLKAWRNAKDTAPTPQEQLCNVLKAFLEAEPASMTGEVLAHLHAHKSALANSKTAIAILDAVARAGKVEIMMELWQSFQHDLNLKRSLPMYEVLLGGFATVGDQAKVAEILGLIQADKHKLSARGYSLLIKGFLKNGLVDAVFAQLVAMTTNGLTVPPFAVAQFFRIACDAERGEETFIKAKDAGLPMPSEALASVLEDCVKNNNLTLAEKVRELAKAQSIQFSGSAFGSLLKLYTAAGSHIAPELFREMQASDANISDGLCVSLLARCAESKFLPFAEEIVQQRRATGGMTVSLYSVLMKAYAYSGMYSKACDLYSDILADGLEPDATMYGCLMKFAVECGRTELSQEFAKKVPSMDIQNYMSLIRAAGRDRDVDRAFGVIKELRASNVQPDVAAFNAVLDVCIQSKDMRRAKELLQEMKTLNLLDVITYNTLLKGYCGAGDLTGAKFVLREMSTSGFEPNDVSYNCIINAAVSSGQFQEAWSLIDTMTKKGIKIDQYTVSIMLKTLKVSGGGRDVAKVLDLLDSSGLDICSDEILFNTVLETLIRAKEHRRLEALVNQFESQSSLRPSVPTYGSLIKAMSALNRVDRCWSYWQAIEQDRGLQPNDIVLGCMLDALVSSGKVDDAATLFDEWKTKITPNTVLYSILIKGFASTSQADRAMEACHEMRQQGVRMNPVAYNSIIDAQARSGKMQEVSQVIKLMNEDGIVPDAITYSTIMKGYCVQGDIDRAYDVFKDMKSQKLIKDAIVYNTLIDGCTRHNRIDLAETLIKDLDNSNVTPSNYTLGTVIKMYGRTKQLDKAFAAFDSLPKKGGFAPNSQVLTSLMNACLSNFAADKALAIFEDLKKSYNGADSRSYSTLINGLVRTGKLSQAAWIVDEACRSRGATRILDPESVDNLLSALNRKGMMQQYGEPLMEQLRAAGVRSHFKAGSGSSAPRRNQRGW
eukprot:TRINITY_DN4301_c0_g1_i1.p1 TRINITY_DN4301_c0_g1~~TRINITY_DN4301_c0_g1_i1.p1  ORF type:complete len:1033 (-),score=273.52 TRINITY_DN4301_c0_g1_i1:115-3213(-)